jgi:hypothetical protein
MKKYFYFLAIAVLFAACQPNNDLGTPFQKGQKVTLSATIANPDGGAKQMPGKQRVSGLDDTPSDPTNGAIKLTWNEGDEIKVTVNGVSESFILKSGAGTAEGEFEGFMPAEGTTYTVDYPVTAPNLANQKYVANGFGDELMSMHAENGDLNGFTLEAQNALLGLQLTGNKTLSDIVVTDRNTKKTYTLDCQGVTLKSEATLFYIVVPAGTWANGFKVEVLQDDKSLISDFEKTSSATFTPNKAMVMPTKVADYDLKTLTFEDKDSQFGEYTLSIDNDWSGGSPYSIYTWNDLIPQGMQGYGAPMIYGGDDTWEFYFDDWNNDPTAYTYFWYDQNNTELAHTILGDYMNGGIAVSNYVSEDYASYGTYDYQLTAYATGGNSGTNFGALNVGFGSSGEPAQPIFFADGQEHVIDHMYINLSTYMYAEALGLGWDLSAKLAEDDTYTVVVTGYNSNDEETGSANIDLYKEGTFINGWTKLDLSSLGKVANIKFHVECDKNTIAHFVIDDIAVRFLKE